MKMSGEKDGRLSIIVSPCLCVRACTPLSEDWSVDAPITDPSWSTVMADQGCLPAV